MKIKMSNNTAKELSNEHWRYIKSLLETHKIDEEVIKQIGFHYTTAFVHGWKHGIEHFQEQKLKFKNFIDRIGG